MDGTRPRRSHAILDRHAGQDACTTTSGPVAQQSKQGGPGTAVDRAQCGGTGQAATVDSGLVETRASCGDSRPRNADTIEPGLGGRTIPRRPRSFAGIMGRSARLPGGSARRPPRGWRFQHGTPDREYTHSEARRQVPPRSWYLGATPGRASTGPTSLGQTPAERVLVRPDARRAESARQACRSTCASRHATSMRLADATRAANPLSRGSARRSRESP